MKHICLVQDACSRLACSSWINPEIADSLIAVAAEHDRTRYSVGEMCAYQRYWGVLSPGQRTDQKELAEYQKCNSRHYACNPHHPEHWQDPCSMDRVYMLEMVADWYADSVEDGVEFEVYAEGRISYYGMDRVRDYLDLAIKELS